MSTRPSLGAGGRSALPNFLIIGAMKAGTTSLYRLLGTHPSVFMPENKEPDFFVAEKSWNKGLEWYRGLFATAAGVPAVGEASTSYSKRTEFVGVPERIAAVVPDVRLDYLMREPISRMRSMYLHNVREGRERAPADKALLERPMYLDASRYAFQLEAFLEYFPSTQLHVLKSEHLRHRPQDSLESLARFLDIDPHHRFMTDGDHNTAEQRRMETPLSRFLRRAPGKGIADRLLPKNFSGMLYRVTTVQPVSRVHADLETRTIDLLRQRLRPDMQNLRHLLGRDFDPWGLLD